MHPHVKDGNTYIHGFFYHIYYEALKLRVRSMYEKILTYLVAIVPGLANELLELL